MRKKLFIRREIFKMWYSRCAYCSTPLDFKTFHIDHIEPLHRGRISPSKAEDLGLNCLSNLTPSCAPCNMLKSNMNLEQFRGFIKSQITSLNMNKANNLIFKREGIKLEEERFEFWFEYLERIN